MTKIFLLALSILASNAQATCDCYAHLYSGRLVLVRAGMADYAACKSYIDQLEASSDTDYTPAAPVCQ